MKMPCFVLLPGRVAVAVAVLLAVPGVGSAAAPVEATADPAAAAWANLQESAKLPPMPAAWRQKRPSLETLERFRERTLDHALTSARAARGFVRAFPDSPHVTEARQLEHRMLSVAERYGDRNAGLRLAELEETLLHDPHLDTDAKAALRYQQVQRQAAAQRPADPQAYLRALEAGAREMLKEFPGNATPYRLLLSVAGQQRGAAARRICEEIGDDARAPAAIREQARGILRNLDALGKPMELKFTATDGREVDLAKLRGKVVLVDFWATWCGPCVAELPEVKAAYEKLHDRGFEILGISLDKDRKALDQFVKQHALPWPQYFDGRGWSNAMARRFGIQAIPAMWLVDRQGVVRDQNARGNLAAKVEKLLAKESPPEDGTPRRP